MADRRPLDCAWQAWSAAMGAVLAFDAALVMTGRPSLSKGAAAHRGVTAGLLAYLCCHLLGWPSRLARFDPLALAGALLSRRNS